MPPRVVAIDIQLPADRVRHLINESLPPGLNYSIDQATGKCDNGGKCPSARMSLDLFSCSQQLGTVREIFLQLLRHQEPILVSLPNGSHGQAGSRIEVSTAEDVEKAVEEIRAMR